MAVDYPPATARAADQARQAAYVVIVQSAEVVLAAQQTASVVAGKLIPNPLDPRTIYK